MPRDFGGARGMTRTDNLEWVSTTSKFVNARRKYVPSFAAKEDNRYPYYEGLAIHDGSRHRVLLYTSHCHAGPLLFSAISSNTLLFVGSKAKR